MYIAAPSERVAFERELADARVLMDEISRGGLISIKFIVVSGEDRRDQRESVEQRFAKIRKFVKEEFQDQFSFEIWDEPTITEKEYELGIKIPAE